MFNSEPSFPQSVNELKTFFGPDLAKQMQMMVDRGVVSWESLWNDFLSDLQHEIDVEIATEIVNELNTSITK